MTVSFNKIRGQASYLDPNQGFETKQVDFEIRFDPLTNTTGRIVTLDHANPSHPDLDALVKASIQTGCPYCPVPIETQTAKFPPDLAPGGHIRQGKAVVMPNPVPYDTYAAVCLFSDDHFIPLGGFSPELLRDALMACQAFFRRVAARSPETVYYSINWNYMPPAGSRIVHPHLQPIAGEAPTNSQAELIRASHEYVTQHITHYWRDLVEKEEEIGERFVGKTGRIFWLSPFVPAGSYPDTMGIFGECPDLLHVEAQDWDDFSCGLAKILGFYHSIGIHSVNFSLFSGSKGDPTVWVHARVTPRFSPPPLGNCDVTFFGILHKEPVSVMAPEEMAPRLRSVFSV